MLGDIEPVATAKSETQWRRSLDGAQAEAVLLQVEDDIQVPLMLLLPEGRANGVVVAVAQGGKDRLLTGRSKELETLLRAGLAVCLPDLRGTGLRSVRKWIPTAGRRSGSLTCPGTCWALA
jgi:hypothetical protein